MPLELIRDYWDKNGFDILVLVSIVFFLFYAISRIGKVGTYSNTVFMPDEKKKKAIPKESKGETICRRYLERKFNRPFPKIRPRFLRNPVTGGEYNLELDCFNEELKLGVEYNGIQHYKFSPYFHKNKEAFLNQKYRDEMKRVKCREAGVILIEVPYTVPHENIENYIDKELEKIYFSSS
uniref:DUF559 domain-containing protein n=1 Tax=viral metagenome TaxID=1070528 RepID=A0A6C0KU43_9ZZZZ